MKDSCLFWLSDQADAGKVNRFVLMVLILLPLVVFSPALSYEFVEWDDDVNIIKNAHVSGLAWPQLKWMLTDVRLAHRYMPLGWLCYAVERTLWMDNPFIFHLGNLVLHTVNGLLLFTFLKRILSQSLGRMEPLSTRIIFASGTGALFWSLHPLRTEVVSWCASRIYLMATLWFILSLLSYLRGVEHSTRAAYWRWASIGFFSASLLTYPIMLFGGVVFVLVDLFVLHRIPTSIAQWPKAALKQVWLEKLPYLLLGAACLGVTLATRTVGQPRGYLETLDLFGLPHRVAQGFYAWAYYAWKPWWPFDLAPRYGALLSFNPTDLKFLVSFGVVIGLTGALVWLSRRWPLLLGLWVGHLLLYFPFIGLTEHPHSTYDRYTYLPGMLWAIVIATTLWKIWPRPTHRFAFFVTFGAIACGLITLSSQQTQTWENTASVRLSVARSFGTHPAGAQHEEIAGQYLLRRKMLVPARECFLRALRLIPDDVDARIYLGDILAEMGWKDEALREYNKAVLAKAPSLRARNNLGVAFCKLGRYREGAAVFESILESDPDQASAKHNLTLALQKLAAGGRDDPVR